MADQEDRADKEHADAGDAATPERPGETFKQGISLLWRAARSAADEIKREVEKGGVTDALRQAGRDLETAATQAARTLEGFIERVGPGDPKTTDWKGAEGTQPKDAASQWKDAQNPKRIDVDPPEDGDPDDKPDRHID